MSVKYMNVENITAGTVTVRPGAGWDMVKVTGFVRRETETDLYLDAVVTVTLPNGTELPTFVN